MDLALWVLPGATTSQMRRGERNNNASSYVPTPKVHARTEACCQARCYMFSARCTTEVTGVGATDIIYINMMFKSCAAAVAAARCM